MTSVSQQPADVRGPAPTLEFASALDVGRLRGNNEDAVALDADAKVVVLADGMGGYNAGEVASGMASSLVCTSLVQWFRQQAQPTINELALAIERAVDRANRAIFEASHANPHYSGMGTTLAMLAVAGSELVVGHVGDSRVYRLRDGQLQRLTRDHSMLQEQLDAGLITPAQAARSLNRNLVTRALGVEAEVMLELRGHNLLPGDVLLLCSDGLTDMLDDASICRLLCHTHASLQDACHALVDAANAAGGRDNISVVLVRAWGEAHAHAHAKR